LAVDNQGTVMLESCTLIGTGLQSNRGIHSDAGASVTDSAAVTFSRCDLRGGGVQTSLDPGLQVSGFGRMTKVRMYECLATGTSGLRSPSDGAPGAEVTWGVKLFASGCVLQGGGGADGVDYVGSICLPPGNGGPGISAAFGNPEVTVVDTQLLGGNGGAGSTLCTPGAPGPPSRIFAGTLSALAGTVRSLAAESPAREGTSFDVSYGGLPGELALTSYAVRPVDFELFQFLGVLHLLPPITFLHSALVGPSGSVTVTVPLPPFLGGAEEQELLLQTAFVGGGGVFLSSPSVTHVLAATF